MGRPQAADFGEYRTPDDEAKAPHTPEQLNQLHDLVPLIGEQVVNSNGLHVVGERLSFRLPTADDRERGRLVVGIFLGEPQTPKTASMPLAFTRPGEYVHVTTDGAGVGNLPLSETSAAMLIEVIRAELETSAETDPEAELAVAN